MSSPHLSDNEELLIGYLYSECGPDERRQVEEHLAECAGCRSEVREMQSVRATLNGWTPPEARLGFRVVADPPPARRRWALGPLPVWAQAAAAVFLFAAGAAVSQLTVRYGTEGVTIGTRWARPAGASAQASSSRSGPASGAGRVGGGADSVQPSVALPEQELRQGLEAAARPASAEVSARNQDELLRQVRAMIEQSEQRQQRELALRLAQVVRDFDTQRRADLLRVDQNLGQLEGQTGAAVAQQRELLNYLVRVSDQP
jgi:hypothetical protein